MHRGAPRARVLGAGCFACALRGLWPTTVLGGGVSGAGDVRRQAEKRRRRGQASGAAKEERMGNSSPKLKHNRNGMLFINRIKISIKISGMMSCKIGILRSSYTVGKDLDLIRESQVLGFCIISDSFRRVIDLIYRAERLGS